MAVAANALETYDSKTIREDLQEAENMISPTETPFYSMIAGRMKATSTLHEWPLLELAAVNSSNRVAEGEDAPTVSAPDVAMRRSNYTQISFKNVKVSSTAQAVDGAADIEKLAKQVSYKLKELKRDKEQMLLDNTAADPGAAAGATVRKAAGLPAFLITNASRGTGGTAPTLSGTTNGYPNGAAGDGTLRDLTEDLLNTVIQSVWTQGGDPRYCLVSPINKRVISTTFNAYATKYKDADDKKLVTSVNVYESDFGTVQIVPNRFQRGRDVFVIDPDYVDIAELQPTKQEPLAKTGLTDNRLISCEYTLHVGNEKAQGIVADTNG
jgi:hypothetical protein